MLKYALFLTLFFSVSYSQTITSVSIVDSNGGIWWNLRDNDTIFTNKIPEKWNIYATVTPKPYKVNFTFRSFSNSERLEPYAMYGDGIVKSVPVGFYSVSIVAYPTYKIDASPVKTIRFTILPPRPKLVAKFSGWGYIPLVGQSTHLSVAIFDTVNGVTIDTVKSIRMLVDAPNYPGSASVLMLGPPYFWNWSPRVIGKHVIRGEGLDMFGNKFLIQPDSLYVITQKMVDTAKFVNKAAGGYINAIINK